MVCCLKVVACSRCFHCFLGLSLRAARRLCDSGCRHHAHGSAFVPCPSLVVAVGDEGPWSF